MSKSKAIACLVGFWVVAGLIVLLAATIPWCIVLIPPVALMNYAAFRFLTT